MRKFSYTYIKLMAYGVIFLILAIGFTIGSNATMSAVFSVLAFIYLWVPQMLPDYEKYRNNN